MRYRVRSQVWVWLLASLWAAAASGCKTMSQADCVAADWRAVGLADGSAGAPAERLERHRAACARYRVEPDAEAYRRGREAGVELYCRPENGYRVGSDGARYEGACPAALEASFLEEYRAGARVYEASTRVRETESQLYQKQTRANEIAEKHSRRRESFLSDDVPVERKAQLLEEMKALKSQHAELEKEIETLTDELAERRAELRRAQER